MRDYAVAIVIGVTEHGLAATMLDQMEPHEQWQTVDLRWGLTKTHRRDKGLKTAPSGSDIEASKAAFEALRAAPPVGALVAVHELEGFHDHATGKPFAAGFDFPVIVQPDDAQAAIRTFFNPGEQEVPRFNAGAETLFMRIPGYVNDPKAGFVHMICADTILHEADADLARGEPDEALIWIGGPDNKGAVMAHHGAYLFFQMDVDSDLTALGFSGLPEEKGLYYVTGSSWSETPSGGFGDYDSGFDVGDTVLATDEHLAKFGIEPGGLAADIEDYELNSDEAPEPSPSVSGPA